MTEKSDIKKINKLKERVYELLEKNRHNDDNKEGPTHLSYGLFNGKFFLDKVQRKELMSLYIKAVTSGVNDFSILERPKEYAPIIVDVDLEIPSDNYVDGTRLYSNELILNVIQKYLNSINKYLDVPEEKLKVCVFEKQKPTEKEGTYKDGFHLVFPELCVQTKVRHLLRYYVVKICDEEGIFQDYVNSPDKIIDKSVVSTNGWFLYGSKKPNGQIYTLSSIYDSKLNKTYDTNNNDENISMETLINNFSLQSNSYSRKNVTPLQDEYVDSDIDMECEKLGITSTMKSEQIKYDIPACKEDDVRRATKYTMMLNDTRSRDYHGWLHVGLALHNIDNSLLQAWIEFSKKCGPKFKEGECEKMWKTMKNPSTGNILTIRSLAYWAKQDDPKQYEAFNKEEFKNMMKRSLDGNTYYLAKSVYSKYSDRFVCSSIKSNCWWEFRNHRWNRIEAGYTLKVLLSEDFANEYNKEIAEISLKATTISGMEREELQQRRTRIDKIVEKLMNTTFKKVLMDECTSLFYDATFEQKLDSNVYLVGFENGVYDLEQSIFREGRPDDYISLSTKNDYHKWNEKNPFNVQINKFFSQVLPNDNVRDYFLNALCTCFAGTTKEEKLYIMTGSGSNGKSLTMDLMYLALGDYYMSCPITIITRKRGSSNETSPEKVRMKGRRCGVFQETDDGEKLNVGVMKEFTGGDKVLVRDLFKGAQEMIEFKPQMKYFLTCNQLPEVPSNDDGTWRRLRVIAFTSKFTDKPTKENEFMIDTMLKQKIEMWAPTFASYLIHVYNTQYKNKKYLEDPVEVMAYTKQYKMENDFYTEYANDRVTITSNPKDIIGHETMWEDFRVWYKDAYEGAKLPKKTDFTKMMIKIFGGDMNKKRHANVVFNPKKDETGQASGSDDEVDKPKGDLDV
jgi:P4 family phage/plasmid primase-like protien